MRKLLEPDNDLKEGTPESAGSLWLGRVMGFLGSGVILWIILQSLGPALAETWGISWILKTWTRAIIVVVAAAIAAIVLSRIEGTIWAKYYVIIGYLLSLVLIIWIVLHLLHYV